MLTSTPQTATARDRLFTPAFVLLAVADLAYFTADGIAIYALPVYVTGPVGAGEAGVGLAFGAFALSALVLRPFAGRLCDTWGRRPLLVGGALLGAAAMLGTAFVDSLAAVVALRLLVGVAEAAFFVASFSALADLAPPSRLGEALSYNSLGLYLGLGLGPPLAELVVTRGGFAAAWYVATLLCLTAALVASRIGETRPDRTGVAPPTGFIHWPAIAPGLGFLASIVAMGGFLAFAALHAQEVGMSRLSLAPFVYGAVVVACRIAFAKVPDRLPPLVLGTWALLTMTVGMATIAVWTTPTGMIAGTVLLGAGVAFSTPAFFAAIFSTAAPSQRGAASGTATLVIDLGIGVGPILLGPVAQAAGLSMAFAVAATLTLAGAAWTAFLRARTR